MTAVFKQIDDFRVGFTTAAAVYPQMCIRDRCLVSELLARRMKTPVTTFLICALIPLVPGGGMYYTMLAIIQGNTMNALEIGIHTLGCAGALALGIALTSAFFSFSMKKS